MHEFRRGGGRLDLQPYESYIAEQVEHAIHSGSIGFDRYPDQRSVSLMQQHNIPDATVTMVQVIYNDVPEIAQE